MADINPNVLAIALAGASKLFKQPGVKGEGINEAANLAIGLGQQQQKNALLAQVLGSGTPAAGTTPTAPQGIGIGKGSQDPGAQTTSVSGIDAAVGSAIDMNDLKQKLLLNALSNIGSSPFLFPQAR